MSDPFKEWHDAEYPGAGPNEDYSGDSLRAAWDAATEAERARAYYVGQKALDAANARIRELEEALEKITTTSWNYAVAHARAVLGREKL